MANDKINYSKRMETMLTEELPDFVSEFIYNFGHIENYATKYEYCRDIRDFFRFIVNFIPEYSETKMKDLTIDNVQNIQTLDINRYLTLLSGNGQNGLKQSTVKRRRATLSSMYGFFVSNGKMKVNPVLATRTIKIPDKSVIYLTNEEQVKLLKTVEYGTNLSQSVAKVHNKYAERDLAMFILMLDTGLRVSEMLSTNICDYDLTECSVVVVRKGGDIQTVYYSDECSEKLDIYFTSQRAKFFMYSDAELPAFTTTSGNRLGIRAVETLVKKYVSACLPDKVKLISPHKLRSSFAMSFYEASDNNILLLQKKLNHKSITTTNIYAKASDKELKESRGLLERKRKDNATS